MKSIYRQIQEAVGSDGALPGGFELQMEGGPQGIKLDEGPLAGQTVHFAPGAQDGINLYHGGWGPDEKQLEQMKRIVWLFAKEKDPEGAIAALVECFEGQDSVLSCADDFRHWIIEHQEELNPSALFHFSDFLLTESDNAGAIKFALCILELLAGNGGEWREHVRTLALSDEFTLFCVFVASCWENRDEELFAMAQKVRGWGRVHAVQELEPTNQEMRDWLLDEGWDNDVLPSYTALHCAQAGGLRERLEGETLSREQLDAADGLIRALLDEGPCRNISRMEDGEDLLLAWLDQVEKTEPNEEDRKTLECLREEERDWPRLRARLEEF